MLRLELHVRRVQELSAARLRLPRNRTRLRSHLRRDRLLQHRLQHYPDSNRKTHLHHCEWWLLPFFVEIQLSCFIRAFRELPAAAEGGAEGGRGRVFFARLRSLRCISAFLASFRPFQYLVNVLRTCVRETTQQQTSLPSCSRAEKSCWRSSTTTNTSSSLACAWSRSLR